MPVAIFDIAFGIFCRMQATISSILIYSILIKDKNTAAFILFSAIMTDFIRFLLRNHFLLSVSMGFFAIFLGLYVSVGALFYDIGSFNNSQLLSGIFKLNTESPFLFALEGVGGADILLGISRGFSLIQNGIFISFSYENSRKLRNVNAENRGKFLPLITVCFIFFLQIFFLFISAAPVHAGLFNINLNDGAGLYIESMRGRLMLVFPFILSSIGVLLAAGFSWIGLNSWKVARQRSRQRPG